MELGESAKVIHWLQIELKVRALPYPPTVPSVGHSVHMSDSQGRKVKIVTDFYIPTSEILF